METVLASLKDTPIPTLLVIAGIIYLLLAIAGQLTGRIAVPPGRQRGAAVIGGVLLIAGIVLHVIPEPESVGQPQIVGQPPLPPEQTSRQLTDIDQILATLPLANIAFNTPATLRLGHSAVIQLFLSMQHSIEELQATISAVGEREGARIRVSDQMEARLSGVGFKIESITPEIQAVSERDITEWKWEIEPTRVGSQYLHLTLSVRLYVADNPVPRTVRTFEKMIEVSEVVVPWPQRVAQFAKDNWQWLWAAIVIPVVGWIIGVVRKRRKDKTAD